jgi:hypothetical protein
MVTDEGRMVAVTAFHDGELMGADSVSSGQLISLAVIDPIAKGTATS